MNKHARVALLSAMTLGLVLSTINSASYADWSGFKKNHPRRAETLKRDSNLNKETNADKGDLGGHYKQIKGEEKGIAKQEQRDAKINGGFITKGQQKQLNKEEGHVQNQINRDQTAKPQ